MHKGKRAIGFGKRVIGDLGKNSFNKVVRAEIRLKRY